MIRFGGVAIVLLSVAGCRAPAPAAPVSPRPGVQTTLLGPSSSPVFELPARAALIARPRGSDWDAIGREAAELLGQYLRINTTNPPGNELAAARFFAAVLAREGIESQIFEPAPGKATLIARLRGDGSRRPLILLNHMDVVEATREFWSVDPFGAEVRDGVLFGRGAQDMKGQGITQLMTMLLLKRSGLPLARDVIFLATPDEEIGGGVGAGWFVEHHPDLIAGAEFLLTEGGTTRADEQGRVTWVGVDVTEKAPFWLHVTARGTAGHGSRPIPDNAVERLVRALGRVAAWETPMLVTPAAAAFFRALGTREDDARRRAWLSDPAAALSDPAGVRFFQDDPGFNALLRNTVSITRLTGSGKVNVIPPIARAEIDVRLLPGQDPAQFLADIRRVIGDTNVSVEPQGVSWPATESPVDNDLYAAVVEEAGRRYPGVLVAPTMLAGFTDAHYFRRMGIPSYGFAPIAVTEAESRGVHGNDEGVLLSALTQAQRLHFEVVARVSGR